MKLFRDLDHDEFELLMSSTRMSTTAAGQIFYAPGDRGQVLFLLKRGRVQLYCLSPGGRKLVLAEVGAGAIFGEMALAGQELYDTFAEALEPCLLYVLSKADMVRLLQKEPRVAVRLLEIVGDRLRRAEMQLMDVTFKTIRARLASVLMDLSEHYGPDITGYTHQDLAERVGTYREGASVALAELQRAGAIALEPQRVRILDVTLLWRISEQGRDVQWSGTGSWWCPPARATGIHTNRKEQHDNRHRTRRGGPTERVHGK
jgi:CRP-like cAMP-binding protein